MKEWQLRMVGIETGEPDTEETDVDGEEDIFTRRRPMGAINPLLVAQGEGMNVMRRLSQRATLACWRKGCVQG